MWLNMHPLWDWMFGHARGIWMLLTWSCLSCTPTHMAVEACAFSVWWRTSEHSRSCAWTFPWKNWMNCHAGHESIPAHILGKGCDIRTPVKGPVTCLTRKLGTTCLRKSRSPWKSPGKYLLPCVYKCKKSVHTFVCMRVCVSPMFLPFSWLIVEITLV